MSEQQFTCWDNNQVTETGLPRPYPCCGFIVPPLNFTGYYVCHKTGNPPDIFPCNGQVQFQIDLTSECPALPPITYLYSQDPNIVQNIVYAYVDLRYDCYTKNGSDKLIMQLYVGPIGGTNTEQCSHVAGGDYQFAHQSIGNLIYDDGLGNTITVDAYVTAVTYP